MNDADLLDYLIDLETRLHRNEVRRDAVALDALLHPDFEEIGGSGRAWSREEIIRELLTEAPMPAVAADRFRLRRLGEDVVLLTYRSSHMSGDGSHDRLTLRASIWMRTGSGWQVRFHQGTPAHEG
ncbi:MAG: nuclear transport factor 2 family protein [Pseudomonadota bacterium]